MKLEFLTWVGNVFILWGLFTLGKAPKPGFVIALIGEAVYLIYTAINGLWGVFALSAVISGIYVRNLLIKTPADAKA